MENKMILGVIGWIVVGVIVGFVATKVVNLRGDDPRLSIGVAGAAAIVAGGLYSLIAGAPVSAWNPWSILFAAIGGVVGAVAWHATRSRWVSHERYVPRRSY
jgi:uncharacterized membrane protein YeaQ/YmgE (transglycosylase-associated protein family)